MKPQTSIAQPGIEMEDSFRLHRVGNELIAEWPGIGTLNATRDGTNVTFTPADGADNIEARKFYRGIVAAFVRHLRGDWTLHASAFAHRGRVIACVGEGGAGKSTFAAFMCKMHGADFLSDDAAPLDFRDSEVFVRRADESLWLTADTAQRMGIHHSGTRKLAVSPPSLGLSEAPLAAIVKLVFDERAAAPMLRLIEGRAAFRTLMQSAFRFLVDDPESVARDFAMASRLAARVPVYELHRSRNLLALTSSFDALSTVLGDS